MIKILPIKAFQDNYIWIVQSQNYRIAIDPGSAEEVIQGLDQELTHVLITHTHQDHIGGLNELKNKFPHLKVFAPEKSHIFDATPLRHLESFQIGDLNFTFWETPGHTLDHGIYWIESEDIVFTGDCLFSLGCGRVFTGTIEQLHTSLKAIQNKLSQKEWHIYPTHEYTLSNLDFLRSIAPHLNLDPLENNLRTRLKTFVSGTLPTTSSRELAYNPFLKGSFDEFKILRLSRNTWVKK